MHACVHCIIIINSLLAATLILLIILLHFEVGVVSKRIISSEPDQRRTLPKESQYVICCKLNKEY